MRLVFLLLFLWAGIALCADPKDDFSEFDAPEDFEVPAKQQQPETSTKKPPKEEVRD
jgi:hypothetical protein